jgi:hypothetical protein
LRQAFDLRSYYIFPFFLLSALKPSNIQNCFEMELLELSEVLLLRFTGAQRFSSTSIKIDDCFLFQSFSIRFWGEFVLSKKSYKNPENDQFRWYYAGKYLRTFSI